MDTSKLNSLANNAFSIIELLEVSNINDKSFLIIRKKLLDLGNDILRLEEEGE